MKKYLTYMFFTYLIICFLSSCKVEEEHYFTGGRIASGGETIKSGHSPTKSILNIEEAYDTDCGISKYKWYNNNVEVMSDGLPQYKPLSSDLETIGDHTYTRKAVNGYGKVQSSAGSWTISVQGCDPQVRITNPLQSHNLCTGDNLILSVTAINALSYQWKLNGVNIEGATDTTYTINSVTKNNSGTYTVAAFNDCIASSNAKITVYEPFNAGEISSEGQLSGIQGAPITIGVKTDASGGDGQYLYRWLKNGQVIAGATGRNYTPPASDLLVEATNTYTRQVADKTCNTSYTNSTGSWIVSVRACLPTITNLLQSQEICYNGDLWLTVNTLNARGYQWKRNGIAISGATRNSFRIYSAGWSDEGTYSVEVTGTCGTVTSNRVEISVLNQFDAGSIYSGSETIKLSETASTISNYTSPTGGGGNFSYQWYMDGYSVGSSNSETYTPSVYYDNLRPGTYVFTRKVYDDRCNDSGFSNGEWTLTVLADEEDD